MTRSWLISGWLLLWSCQVFAALTEAELPVEEPVARPTLYQPTQDKASKRQFIVQFSALPTLAYQQDMRQQLKRNKSHLSVQQQTQRLQNHANRLIDDHFSFEQRLKQIEPSARVNKRFSTLLNAAVVESQLSSEQLSSMATVQRVFPVKRYKRKLANALPIIGADQAWQLVGGRENAGKNIKIAVIDSGILPAHPIFDDSNMEPLSANELPTDDYCRTTDQSFCNNKVIVARHYLPSFVNLASSEEYDSPKALSGHGVHVAAIAAGRQVTADNGELISGVAPGAYLMAYKALWGQEGEGTDVELYQAIEDAYQDGADVINNSWGGENGGSPANTVYQSIYQLLENEGVVVVTAVGNEGEDNNGNRVEQSVACPACVEAGIAVGTTTTDLVYGLPVQVNEQTFYAQPADNYFINSPIHAAALLAPASNSLGCSAWSDSDVQGKVAVVHRGSCFFEEKAKLAQNAGAVGLIVINNVIEANITMAMGDATLPAVLVSKSDGQRLIEHLTEQPNSDVSLAVNLVVGADPAQQDFIAPFSSLGPNGDEQFIKPDLAAPGVAILSATSDEDFSSLDEDYVRLNGSSMAAPMVAGAAALVKQQRPNLSAKQIKSILINSSDQQVKNSQTQELATPFETGAGRLNVLNAVNALAYADQPNMAKPYCITSCVIDNTLNSLADSTQVWQASLSFDQSEIKASVTPSEITLTQTGQSMDFSVDIDVPRDLTTDWYFGRLTWTNSLGDTVSQAIAIHNQTQQSNLLQLTLGAEQNGQKQLTLTSTNVSDSEQVDIDLALLGSAQFAVPSIDITTSGSYSVTTATEQKIAVSAQLSQGQASFISESSPIQVDLATENVEPITCDLEGCDDVLYELDFDFLHYGENYSQLMMSDNGFILAGNNLPAGADLYFNRALPSDITPNNLIAPFWTDFDLTSEAEANSSGYLMAATYPVNGDIYMVLQWQDVQLYTDEDFTPEDLGVSRADLKYSFQVILQQNSENKWFRYLAIPEQPNFYSVGIENADGSLGATYWFDGQGQAPVNSGDSIGLSLNNVGQLTLTTQIANTNNSQFTTDDEFQVTAGVATQLNVLSNDLVSAEEAVVFVKVNDIEQVQTVFSGQSEVVIEQSSLAIINPPQHGVISLLDSGLLNYTADIDYVGQDSFTYRVDNSDEQSSTAEVLIDVQAPVAPDNSFVVDIVGVSTIASNGTQTYSAQITPTNNAVTYRWTLPAQLSASNLSGSSIEVTASEVAQSTVVSLALEVTSGEVQVSTTKELIISPADKAPATDNELEDNKSSGLTVSGALMQLLLALVVFRRVMPVKRRFVYCQ